MQPEKLKTYNDLLVKWQKAINLVSGKTLSEAKTRHFEDSAQLHSVILSLAKDFKRDSSASPQNDKLVVADLGSGGGFPGMVLAMLNPELEMHLIESDERKCQFLRVVSRETNTTVSIRNGRVENILKDLNPDIITARAFASLREILDYTQPCWQQNPDLKLLLLKGQNYEAEIAEAEAFYRFDSQAYPSKTDPNAAILQISAIQNK